MKSLRTLNIRNLPATSTAIRWIADNYLLDSLASMMLDITRLDKSVTRSTSLKIVAIGALTYGNVHIGVNHFPEHRFANFLQLRIYRVVSELQDQIPPRPRLQLIAKGTLADAYGIIEDHDLFSMYWLDAAPQEAYVPPE